MGGAVLAALKSFRDKVILGAFRLSKLGNLLLNDSASEDAKKHELILKSMIIFSLRRSFLVMSASSTAIAFQTRNF